MRRRERAHDQHFLADAGSEAQVVERNRGPIGGGHLLDGILNRRASLSVKCGGGKRRECGDRAEKFSSLRDWSSLQSGWAGSVADCPIIIGLQPLPPLPSNSDLEQCYQMSFSVN